MFKVWWLKDSEIGWQIEGIKSLEEAMQCIYNIVFEKLNGEIIGYGAIEESLNKKEWVEIMTFGQSKRILVLAQNSRLKGRG